MLGREKILAITLFLKIDIISKHFRYNIKRKGYKN